MKDYDAIKARQAQQLKDNSEALAQAKAAMTGAQRSAPGSDEAKALQRAYDHLLDEKHRIEEWIEDIENQRGCAEDIATAIEEIKALPWHPPKEYWIFRMDRGWREWKGSSLSHDALWVFDDLAALPRSMMDDEGIVENGRNLRAWPLEKWQWLALIEKAIKRGTETNVPEYSVDYYVELRDVLRTHARSQNQINAELIRINAASEPAARGDLCAEALPSGQIRLADGYSDPVMGDGADVLQALQGVPDGAGIEAAWKALEGIVREEG